MAGSYPGQHLIGHDPHQQTGPRPIDALEQLVMSVLVAVGERDVPGFREMAAVLARRIPGAQYHVVADAGHVINMEQPAVVNALLARFLDQPSPAAAAAPARHGTDLEEQARHFGPDPPGQDPV